MTDSNKKTLSLSLPSGVSKTQSTNRIRQSFSHGKSKVVAVEIKKKRFVGNRSQTNSEVSKIYPNGDLTNSEVEKRLEVVKKAIEDKKARKIEKAKLLEQQRLQEEIEKEQKEETSSLMEETVISAAETPSSDNVVQELRTDKVVDSKKI